MLRLGARLLLNVQRILEGDLLVGAYPVEGRDRRVEGLEVEMAQRVPVRLSRRELPHRLAVGDVLLLQGRSAWNRWAPLS
ncbi:MAG: hypothetical protein R2864_07850 [Syntrophotaleaceae bacterium]